MPFRQVPQSVFQKASGAAPYTVTTGAGTFTFPNEDVDALYGPGWPVQPTTMPQDSEVPRTIDYPVGINFTIQPRIGYDGLMPCNALKAAYTNLSEVSAPVNLLIRELAGFNAILRDRKTHQKVASGHPYEWMTTSPDRIKPFNVWTTLYKKSAKIYAAPAFYIKRQNGKTVAMEYIDGSTLFLIINARGNLPEPHELDSNVEDYIKRIQYEMQHGNPMPFRNTSMPELVKDYIAKQQKRVSERKSLVTTTPAFTQIIKGIPFSFWDKSQVYFMPEPPAPAVDSPYGETYIERAWSWINLIAVMIAFEIGHYRTGNTPEGIFTLPEKMFPSIVKIAAFEREWNARMSDTSQVQAARNRMMPEGTKWFPTKKPDFPQSLYQQAKEEILAAIGVPVAETGKKPNKGLGGKGFEDGLANELTRQFLEVEKESLEAPFNHILRMDGVDDVEFYLDYPQEEISPEKQQEDMWNKFTHGLLTLNDCLSAMGREPIGNPKDPDNTANMHFIIAGNSIYSIEHLKIADGGLVEPNTTRTPTNESPRQPEDGIVDEEKRGQKADPKTLEKLLHTIEESGGDVVGTRTYSLPSFSLPVHDFSNFNKIDKIHTDGAMICLYPPLEIRKKLRAVTESLKLPRRAELETVDNIHLTLAYLPQYEVARERAVDLVAVLEHVRAKYPEPLKCKIQGYGVFNGEDGMSVLYATLDCPELPFLRTDICKELDFIGVPYARDHGFVPHITLAYFPENWKLPKGFSIADMEMVIGDLYLTLGEDRLGMAFRQAEPMEETQPVFEYVKHCGVCDGDEQFFGAPVVRKDERRVTMRMEEGGGEQNALWIPADGTGRHKREEAAWLLDQSLGFGLVPLAYVTETPDGEEGVAIWDNEGGEFISVDGLSEDWRERYEILCYLKNGDSFLIKHPDEEGRAFIFDNGNSFEFNETVMTNEPSVSPAHLTSLSGTMDDTAVWKDVEELIGISAARSVRERVVRLVEKGV
jgi:2'-5' RNA ligase